MEKDKYQIKNEIDFEAALIAVGYIYYPYADPDVRKRYDEMSEDEKIFIKEQLTMITISDIIKPQQERR